MTITETELSNFKPGPGLVLIELEGLSRENVTRSGITLFLTSISGDAKAHNSVKNGIVVAAPETTRYSQSSFSSLDTDVQVAPGDRVYFDYWPITEYLIGMKTGKYTGDSYITRRDRHFFLLPYGYLFVREREGVRTGLNGLIIGTKPIKTAEGLEISDSEEKQALVVSMYSTSTDQSEYEPVIGDKVVYSGTARPIEHPIHDTEGLYFVRPQNVMAVYG